GIEDSSIVYTRKISITTLNNNEKSVSSTVTWEASPERTLTVELVTFLTNWPGVEATGGDTGGGGLSGDWNNPRTLGSIDLGPGNSATDLDVKNKIVYVSAEASAVSKPDFFIIDATDGQNPVIKSDINVGSKGLNALDAAGNYVYAANQATTKQLVVIDVSNINSPVIVTSSSLPGVSGSGGAGNTIFYFDSKIYIATKKATGPEFHVFDVSNPLSPTSLGSFEMDTDVNSIYVFNNVAYVAVSADDELRMLNISNPASISQIGNYDAPGDTEDGKVAYLVGTRIYLGRLVGGNHTNHHEFHIIDVSSSSSPQNLGSVDLAVDLNDLRTRDSLAFFGTSDSNNEFQVWNISNPSNLSLVSSFNFPQVASGIDYEDNLVYVAVRSNDALRIITSTP
ncbi:MAG: hypothetical protein AAB482_01440, partial [Patescibacteria group bacterium]